MSGYNKELNTIFDAAEQGKKIKTQFDLCVSYVQKLNEFCAEARDEEGNLTSPVLSILSEEYQTETKEILDAIESANNVYLDLLSKINNPDMEE